MDHPNAIYFYVAASLVFLVIGILFVAAAMNKGMYKSVQLIPKWAMFALGIALIVLNLVFLYRYLGHYVIA